MSCRHVRLPDGRAAIVCVRRDGGAGQLNVRRAHEPAPSLPLVGGSEAESARLNRMLACAEREAGKRRTFYPRWVEDGRMSAEAAARETTAWDDVVGCLADAQRGAPPADHARIDRLVSTAARECERRRRAYPNLIARGTLTRTVADRELAEMAEVLAWLQEQRSAPR